MADMLPYGFAGYAASLEGKAAFGRPMIAIVAIT
jgi:hypothetical protein